MCREFAQKQVVSRCVADETTDKKASEALFLQLRLNLFNSSLEMTIWLQPLAHRSPVRWKHSVLKQTGGARRIFQEMQIRTCGAQTTLHRNEEEKPVRR